MAILVPPRSRRTSCDPAFCQQVLLIGIPPFPFLCFLPVFNAITAFAKSLIKTPFQEVFFGAIWILAYAHLRTQFARANCQGNLEHPIIKVDKESAVSKRADYPQFILSLFYSLEPALNELETLVFVCPENP